MLIWRAHYLMERRFSGLSAYIDMYDLSVREWERIVAYPFIDQGSAVSEVARTCQTITYGMLAHAHIRYLYEPDRPMTQEPLKQQLTLALLGYLRAVTIRT